ncbi:MAG: diacylglycerol kinase [Coriobacteriia bacterium]|nr:diacylglycerol kinase [Coriobacteriia bacterium]
MPTSNRSILWSFNYAISGVVYALRTQRNMRIHVAAALASLIVALVLQVGTVGLVAIVFAISLVFVTELANTAIEAAVDVATTTYDPLAKVAKDVAAGAVLVAATNALVIAYLVLFDPVTRVASHGLVIVEAAPATLTVIALGLTLLIVIILKALTREGSFVHGGWPSGHAALAFGAAASLAYVTNSVKATVLAFFIAVLVAQSRVEGEIHTISQVILGALLGTLTVTAIYQVFFR